MNSKNTILKKQLDEFKRFLDARGTAYRPGKGEYQVLQVMTVSDGWQPIYRKKNLPDHYKLSDNLVATLICFYSEKRQNLKENHSIDSEALESIRNVLSTVPQDKDNDFTAEWLFLAIKGGKIKHISINY